jgi:hypothetical protein
MKFEKEKEKKEKHRRLPFQPRRPSGPSSLPAPAHLSSSPFFLFSSRTLTTGPRLSASPPPLPFFFFTSLPSRSGAAARFLPRPATSLPSLLTKPAN